ncbi:GTPase IMAP family member 8-like [Hippocampus zosterae]|uniref:GTPase IMAP family member 8-like n=1 Tax=Hippocampus zosterae TaxID=109293 RepID=UPI00223E5A21|nr:GTPase IMAP family member 8-like [Hippocampus zosterae]
MAEKDAKEMPQRRLVLIGARRDGKSSSANTILRKERFESGRIRTAHSEARHEIVENRNLVVVVDTPGWKSSTSLSEISERDKQQLKLYASKCPPGPHAFLLVIPTDSSFTHERRTVVQEHMKLLGDRAWRYTMVLFTFGDYLGKRTIEEHIEREGEALTWLIEKCQNRYHVFNNKDKSNSSQVIELMEKVDDMVNENDDSFYMLDNQMIDTIRKKQEEVAEKATQRLRRVSEQRQKMKMVLSEMEPIQTLRIILLGSRFVGKTSVKDTICGIKERVKETTVFSYAQEGIVGRTKITVVDTPSWHKGFSACDTPEIIKDELLHSLLKCPPGPHVFLLVIDADASFNAQHLEAATTHVELLGASVWKHTMVVFTRGDWRGSRSIEEYIEGEGNSLQSLVERCGNRYHVLDNMNEDDSSQVDDLLEKITLTLAENGWQHFIPNQKMLDALMEKTKRVENAARLRSQMKATRATKGPPKKLKELRILILGEKLSGKTTVANCLLRGKVFPAQPNDSCMARQGQVAGMQVTVVDTPGWYSESECTQQRDREIVRGLTLSPQGFDAVLIVISLDFKFDQDNLNALLDHIKLFGDSIWNHTMVLFTNQDTLGARSLEVFIEREDRPLRWLADKCGNTYHCLHVTDQTDVSQHYRLFEKIEGMSAKNQGRLFCPDLQDVDLRLNKKCKERLRKAVQHMIEQAARKRELKLCQDLKTNLEKLQQDIKEIFSSPLTLATGSKTKKKTVLEDIENQIQGLNVKMMTMTQLRSSMDFGVPSMSGSIHPMDECLQWLSHLDVSTNQDSTLTLNFSESSGYESHVSDG